MATYILIFYPLPLVKTNSASNNICPLLANHGCQSNTPNDWVILEIHNTLIIRSIVLFCIRANHPRKHVVAFKLSTRCSKFYRFRKYRRSFLGRTTKLTMLDSMSPISASNTLYVEQERANNIGRRIANIVSVVSRFGSIKAEFAEHCSFAPL